MTKAILQVGYCQFLVSAKDAQTVLEILDSKSVDVSYMSEQEAQAYETTRGQYVAFTDSNRINATMHTDSEIQSYIARGNAKARYDMRIELEAEERERERN